VGQALTWSIAHVLSDATDVGLARRSNFRKQVRSWSFRSREGGWPLRIGQQNGRLNGPHRGTEVQLIFDVLRETTEEPSELGPEEQASVVLELASADR
jgi:hypothetical protein